MFCPLLSIPLYLSACTQYIVNFYSLSESHLNIYTLTLTLTLTYTCTVSERTYLVVIHSNCTMVHRYLVSSIQYPEPCITRNHETFKLRYLPKLRVKGENNTNELELECSRLRVSGTDSQSLYTVACKYYSVTVASTISPLNWDYVHVHVHVPLTKLVDNNNNNNRKKMQRSSRPYTLAWTCLIPKAS